MISVNCPHCGSRNRHLEYDTVYDCDECDEEFETPSAPNEFARMRFPGEGAVDRLTTGIGRLFGFDD